ncbi:Na(+)/citrate cotransporter-like [Oratosquilla oratoria]|uniref:Na(+)/citrate cotransporter-like n=1 Tax=Oratosquilla oratoria TaxID=337810 RepID=UPI003F7652B3
MMPSLRVLKVFWRSYVVVLAPTLLAPLAASSSTEVRCSYVMLIVAIFWMTEAIPIAIASMIPIFAFPLLGVLGTGDVCLAYMNHTNMMFLGGLMVAIAVEHSNLHRRIAFLVLLHVGQSPRRLMAGFMLVTMFLSMWISNTATTAMMTPVIGAILNELTKDCNMKDFSEIEILNEVHQNNAMTGPVESQTDDTNKEDRVQVIKNKEKLEANTPTSEETQRLRNMCFLGTAYAANVGGTGSLIGTGPNIVLKGILESTYSEPTGLNFSSWMAFNVPGMLICVMLAWLWLQFHYIGIGKTKKIKDTTPNRKEAVKRLIQQEYEALGSITFHETVVLSLFSLLVFCWFFRDPEVIPGWSNFFKRIYGPNIKVGNASPVMLVVFLLFIIPSKAKFWVSSDQNGCLTWKVINEKMPWCLILLLGGGFSMAAASKHSGLSTWMGHQLSYLEVLPKEAIVLVVCLIAAMITEIVSNVGTSGIILPVLLELAVAIKVNPLYFMLPAAVCCSYAFMLPVATAPNAIVHAASQMRNVEMIHAGFVMNIACVCVINIMINTLGVIMFDVKNFPTWANSSTINMPV